MSKKFHYNNQLENVPIAMHCNLSPLPSPVITSVVFRHEAHTKCVVRQPIVSDFLHFYC